MATALGPGRCRSGRRSLVISAASATSRRSLVRAAVTWPSRHLGRLIARWWLMTLLVHQRADQWADLKANADPGRTLLGRRPWARRYRTGSRSICLCGVIVV